MSSILALTNDILQSIIVIFGVAVVMYNLKYIRRDRIIRAFSLLLLAVVLVYFTELLVSRTTLPGSAETWLFVKWIGICAVPAVQFHLSDALLRTTGSFSRRRRIITVVAYALSFVFLLLVANGLIVSTPIELPNAVHFSRGSGFAIFSTYYWLTSLASIYNAWRAYKRCITTSTRIRMRNIFFAIMAAPLSVFPYLSLAGNDEGPVSNVLWIVLIAGNLLVGLMFSQLTANIVYLGSVSSDRVVRVRLYKFMARVPMTASLVLLAYVLANRATTFLGVGNDTGSAIAGVATLMIVEWGIHAYKGRIERLLQFNNEPDVIRIQELSERLLTSRDMQQYLESLLAAGCDVLRIPTAFVVSLGDRSPRVEALIGSKEQFDTVWTEQQIKSLPIPTDLGNYTHDVVRWHSYWISPLVSQNGEMVVGLLGLEATDNRFELDVYEAATLRQLEMQSAEALEDQILQQGVFAAVEGLLPGITQIQQRRGASRFSGASLLEDGGVSAETPPTLASNPEFKQQVREALNHYWGGPKLTESPLLQLEIVQNAAPEHGGNRVKALRSVLKRAIETQKPEGEPSLTRTEWLLYNILELKFVQGQRVRDIAQRLAMSESDLYRKQRVAIENVARSIANMESEKSEQASANSSA